MRVVGAVASVVLMTVGRFSLSMEGVNIEVAHDPDLALVGAGIAIALGLLAGAVPAFRAARAEISEGLRAV